MVRSLHSNSHYCHPAQELLFVSKRAVFSPPTAIRGGIPICWPQFGKMGPVATQHGFARNLAFEVSEQTAESVTLTLRSSEATLAQFPHTFELSVTVSAAATLPPCSVAQLPACPAGAPLTRATS